MVKTQSTIEYVYGDVFTLKPIADVHLCAAACDEKAFIKYLAESDEYTRFIGIGDMVDSIIVSDTKRYRKSGDMTRDDDIVDEQVDRMVSILEPYKDRILGLGSGNHEDEIAKRHGTNPAKRICKALEVPFLGYSFLYRLTFSINKSRTRRIIIRGTHGWGGGSRTQGGDLTKFSRDVAYYDADLFLYGHVHRCQYDEFPRLGLSGEKKLQLYANPKKLVLCGTFLKTLSDNDTPTYSEVKGYPPVKIGSPTITLKPRREAGMDITVTT